MNFCIIRLGNRSKNEIESIDSKNGLLDIKLEADIICSQVPSEIRSGTFCFVYLGSDNNKGIPTKWDQGLRAFGKILEKTGGPTYRDEWTIKVEISIIFSRSLKSQDFIEEVGGDYLKISGIPIIGLSTYSNQTVQLINPDKPNQGIIELFTFLNIILGDIFDKIQKSYPELSEFVSGNANTQAISIGGESDGVDQDDIEKEEFDDSKGIMERPFDPTKINIDTKTPSLDTLIKRIKHQAIQLDTESYFQRKANLWDQGKQSRLIESILIRFPLPAFYFDGSNKDNWLVVDGLQRLSSIRNFVVDKTLILTDLEFLTQLNGKRWDDLSVDLQRLIEESQVVVYIINPGTPSDVKFNIFKRINTGGLILVPQEIRHALFQGPPAIYMAELANTPEFITAMGGKIKTDRMLDRDFANRFLAFYLLGYENYVPDLDTFMSKAMAAVYDMSEENKKNILNRFKQSMILNKQIFGKHAFRKFNFMGDGKKPINKALFDVFSVCFAKLTNSESQKLLENRDNFIKEFLSVLNSSDQVFFWSITSSTSDKNRVAIRFSKIQEIIVKTLQ